MTFDSRIRLIWRLMEGQRRRYGAAVAALILGSAFMYLVPLVPQVVLDGVLTGAPEEASSFVRRAVELGGGGPFLRDHLWIPAAAIVLLTALSGVFVYLRGRWSSMASEETVRRLRDRLYDHLQHLPVSYFDRAETGDLVQRSTSDVETVRMFLATQVVEIGRAVLMLLLPLPLMLALDARMALVSTAFVPPILVFSFVFFRRIRTSFERVDEAEARMTSLLQENLTGVRVVRAFARQEFEESKFDRGNCEHRDLDYRMYVILAWYWSLTDLLCMGQKALVVAAGGYWLLHGQLPVGTFYFFLAAVNLFIWPIRMLGRILTQLGKAMVAVGRIGDILAHPREAEWAASRVPAAAAPVAAIPESAPPAVEFERVSFHHGRAAVLEDLSFAIEPGATVALLGPSGAGKSTIVNLLLRFYEPDRGVVRLRGADVRTLDHKALRSRIAVVMQEPYLYSKSLRDNIRVGRATALDDEIQEAAVTASVHDAIESFDQGYDTLVGERGVTLSGGQRQRVALARALLHEPELMVLDDALSAVDTETEAMIMAAVARRRGQHATLLIAQRLSTLAHADSILVLEHGRVTQRGTHEELMRRQGMYRRLWELQGRLESDLEGLAAADVGAAPPAAAGANPVAPGGVWAPEGTEP